MIDLLYQLVKCELFGKLNIKHHPEFIRLRKENELPTKFRTVGPTELLQRWTYHHLSPKHSPTNITSQPLNAQDFHAIFSSLALGTSTDDQDWPVLLTPQAGISLPVLLDLRSLSNIPLQLLFLAQLAHAAPGLAPLLDIEKKRETEQERDTDPEGTREERAFVTWINGLGIPIFVYNLQYDMNDGYVVKSALK
jgi:plastin-1